MPTATDRYEFKAEIQQVLDILIHSLYTEKEIFLRELVSNASDALNRLKFVALTDPYVADPQTELAIWLEADPEAGTVTIRDSGVGMTQEEMVQNLGTIAHSGAKGFIRAVQEADKQAGVAADVIGQFGVGFYSVFMVAREVTVTSRSYKPGAEAALWASDGQGGYSVGPSDKAERGTTISIKLKDDAKDFAEPERLRQIIKTHSDFVDFPLYLKETLEETSAWRQVNERTALWRKPPREVEAEAYKAFYAQLTFDFAEPLQTLHFSADVPIQFYALLFVPSRRDYKLFKQDEYGLKLYARKVLIRENFKDLLPGYLRFIEGVVDSEDIPLNVSREAVQATPIIKRIRTALTGRITSELKKLAEKDPERYRTFYGEFGHFIKEGLATDPESHERLVDLLRFASSRSESAQDLVSLAHYKERMKPEQEEIYYLLGDDYGVVSRSAHLEYFNKHGLEVLYLTDPVDSFMLMGLQRYSDKPLKNIDDAGLELPQDTQDDTEAKPGALSDDALQTLIVRFKEALGERVADVRESKLLTDSACRLVNPAGGYAASMQRVQRLMGKDHETPKKILELNRGNEFIQNLAARLSSDPGDTLLNPLIEQLYENELLMEGLHPNPAEMIPRIQRLMAEATRRG